MMLFKFQGPGPVIARTTEVSVVLPQYYGQKNVALPTDEVVNETR